MNTFIVVFCIALSVANAAPWATTDIIKGPETSATVLGPDGGKISAHADAGAIELNSHKLAPVLAPAPLLISNEAPLLESHKTVVVEAAPTIIKSTPVITSTKVISHGSTVIQHDPIEIHTVPVLTTKTIVSPIIKTTPFVSVPVHKTIVAPVLTKTFGTVIEGPSGIIKTSGSGHGLIGVKSILPC